MTSVFVTGTDTEVGKTAISTALVSLLAKAGHRVAVMKPIASGCDLVEGEWRNDDAIQLMAAATVDLPYQQVNPYAFEPAIAPHIAAQQVGVEIKIDEIKHQFEQIQQLSDCAVVEGAGGWLVPINNEETLADLAVQLGLPVVIVVDIRLGCINHALLTVAAVRQSGLPVYGWVANQVSDALVSNEIIETLKQRIDVPCLGVVPHLKEGESAANYIRLIS